MMLDDDTGRRTHVPVRSEDRPPEPGPPSQPPADAVRQMILDHLRDRPLWNAERFHTHFRKIHGRHDISLPLIRAVLGQAQPNQRRDERQASSGES
ncbi:MAG: hypothetical protein M3548_19955 [Actinomycetota bacterium]|nr:hypothetical protein [Actinomycetota bacterium]